MPTALSVRMFEFPGGIVYDLSAIRQLGPGTVVVAQ